MSVITSTTTTTTRTFATTAFDPVKPAGNNWKVDQQANGDIVMSSPEMRVTTSKRDGGQVKWETLASDGSVTAEGLSTGDPHDSAKRAGEAGPGQRFDTSGDQKIVIPVPPPNGTSMLLKRVTGDNQTPTVGGKEPTYNGEVMIGNDRDGIVSVKNLHGAGPLEMGSSYDNYPGLSSQIMAMNNANTMVFDPLKGRMLDPDTGLEIDQANVDRKDLVRGGYPAVMKGLQQGGAYFSLEPSAFIFQNPRIWDKIQPSLLSWMKGQDMLRTDSVITEVHTDKKWTLNKFVKGAPAIPMPRTRDCPNANVSPLAFALSEIKAQLFAQDVHHMLTRGGLQSFAFMQNNFRGSATHFQFGVNP